MIDYFRQARKFLVALAGAVAQVIELGLLHGSALHVAQAVSAFLTAVLVYHVPNK